MVDSLREYYLPAISLTILLGYQLAAYFIYQYFKTKKEKLESSKILAAIGIVLGFNITTLLVRTNYLYFNPDPQINEIYNKLGIFFGVLGIILYLLIVSTESFGTISNRIITRILIIFNCLTLISLLILNTSDLIFMYFMLPLFFSFFYVIFVQFKLVALTTGKIKRHLRIIFIGIILFLTGLIIGRNPIFVINEGLILFFLIISPLLLNIGLVMIFLGVYRIPVFLEFDWKEHLIKFFITTQTNLKEIYSYDFQEMNSQSSTKKIELQKESYKDKTITKVIFGIDDIFSQLTNLHNDKLRKIKHGNYYVVIEYANFSNMNITFILVVNEDLSSFRYLINKLKKIFEEKYKFILNDIKKIEGKEKEIFSSFNSVIEELLT